MRACFLLQWCLSFTSDLESIVTVSRMRYFSRVSFAGCLPFIALLLLITNLTAADTRRWTGAEHFANPLHDWSQEDGGLIATPGNFGSRVFKKIPNYEWARLFKSTAVIGESGRFETRFQLRRMDGVGGDAGLWLGLKSLTPSPRNC